MIKILIITDNVEQWVQKLTGQLSHYKCDKKLDLDKYAQCDCAKCNSYRTCIKAALNGTLMRCICFGKIKSEVEEAVHKFNSIPEEYRLSREEIEQLIYETTRK